MESEKVKETLSKEQIIEILKKRIENINPWETHALEYHKGLLDLINELESENESCYEVLADLKAIIKQQNDRIAELEKENMILQGTKNRLTFTDRIKIADNARTIALKQFAERLKEKMSEGEYLGHKYKLAVFRDIDIDETLNEFLKGENNE